MANNFQSHESYPVDLTAATESLISFPTFNQSLNCVENRSELEPSVQNASGICNFRNETYNSNAQAYPNVFHIKQEPQTQSTVYYCTQPGTNSIVENLTFFTEPVKFVDQMVDAKNQHIGSLNLKIEKDLDDEEIVLSEDLFDSQGDPIFFNVSSCEEEVEKKLPDYDELTASMRNISSMISSPQADEMLEHIQNAVDFSNAIARNSEGQFLQPDMENVLATACPTPDTLTASTASSPHESGRNSASLGFHFGSFPESLIHQLNQSVPRRSVNAEDDHQINEQLKINIPEQKPILTYFKFEQQESSQIVYQKPDSVACLMLTQQLATQNLLPYASTPSPSTAHFQTQTSSLYYTQIPEYSPTQNPLPSQSYPTYITTPLGENNYTPTSFSSGGSISLLTCANNSYPIKPLDSSNSNFGGLENIANTPTTSKPHKTKKRKSRAKNPETTDPSILQNIPVLLQRLGLPPNYKLEFVNGGHGIKNPRADFEKLNGSPMVTDFNTGSNAANPMPFVCTVCFKTFKLQRLLNRHNKSHSNIKRYLCTFCGKGFNDTFDLKRHTRTHTGVRPFKCNHCPKSFTQRCSLESHCLKVHKVKHQYKYKERRDKVYVCEECGNTTSQSETHYMHLKVNHPHSPALLKFYDKRHFKFTDSQFANRLLHQMQITQPTTSCNTENFDL